MNCENPSIIINPSLFKVWHRYPYLSIFGKVYNYIHRYRGSKNRGGTYPTYFCAKRTGANLDNYEQCYAFNSDGETFPLYIAVPCGHCDFCAVSKQVQLSTRLMLEQYGAELRGLPKSYFVTLTYAPESLPSDGVCKRDVQLFLKRLRVTLERKFGTPPFRYCVFSEYGKTTHRAHYHMILFGVKLGDLNYQYFVLKKYLASTWKKGFIDVKECHQNSFTYMSKYLLKGSNVPYGKNSNFYLASNRNGGLGCTALCDINIVKEIFNSTDCKITIRVLGIPRTITIPRQVVSYFFRECSSKYRCKLGEHVWNLFKSLQDIKVTNRKCYGAILSADGRSSVLNSVLSRLQFLNISDDLLKDCLSNAVPKFVIERFPFLYDIWASNYHGEYLDTDIKVRDSLAIMLTSLNYLQNQYVDLQTIFQNDLYLQRYKDYFKLLYEDSSKNRENLVAYRCRLVRSNVLARDDMHFS